MARIRYANRDTVGPENQAFFDQLEASRGKPVENIFLAIANAPDLCRGVLAMAMSLRNSKHLNRRLRELAVLTVGLQTEAQYEVDQHWNAAVKVGIPREKLEHLAEYETHSAFSDEDRAVMRYASAATCSRTVDDATWQGICNVLNEQERLELVLTVAWYNCVARIILPLELETEDWYERLQAS